MVQALGGDEGAGNNLVEKISAWREARVDELDRVAEDLRRLEGPWAGWGLFRSAVHQLAGRLMGD